MLALDVLNVRHTKLVEGHAGSKLLLACARTPRAYACHRRLIILRRSYW